MLPLSSTSPLVLTLALLSVRGRLPGEAPALVEPFGRARVRSISEEMSHEIRPRKLVTVTVESWMKPRWRLPMR